MKILVACSLLCASAFIHAQALDDAALIEATKQAVADTLKDPSSAQFKNVIVFDGGKQRAVCGEVNGKNSYGGYVGFKKFYKYETSENAVIKKGDGIMDKLVDLICKP
jgi:hypothetical protein